MIRIDNGKSFVMRNPNSQESIELTVKEVSRLIRGASPFMDSIEIFNNTKSCTVDIEFHNQKVTVTCRNPKDQEFDLNELENPVTPVSISGR